jgi:predicted ArsR family transcriptional regulator
MPSDEPDHLESSLADEFEDELDAKPADDRVYRVALQLTDPARVATVADRADCATDTARRHLRRLVDIGVLNQKTESPDTYVRNESYFEWRKRNRLAELPGSALTERLERLTQREAEFREQYGADSPADVDALEHADHADIEAVWLDLSEWQTVRERIERLEAVRQQRAGTTGVA